MRETHTQSLRAGDHLLFHGRELTLSVTTTLCKPAVRITSQQLQVNFYRNLPQPPLPLLLTRWYRSQALSDLKERTCFWTKRLGVSFNRITIKDQRSRWGSCSSLHNLNYNWRIIMAPEPVIDYLVIHEAAHLVHLNHSEAFWGLVARHDPDYQLHKRWLRDNGLRLFRLLPKENYQ